MRRRLGFIQVFLAGEEDFFYLPDANRAGAFFRLSAGKAIAADAAEVMDQTAKIQPWGWNRSLRHELVERGFSPSLMPDDEHFDKIRQLAHRRTTIPFLEELSTLLPCSHLSLPIEIEDLDELSNYLDEDKRLFLKYPWSSSGRGVFDLSQLTRGQIEEIACGGLRRQHSVMIEKSYEVAHNYATEWTCQNGRTDYLGLSHFISSGRNNYSGNVAMPQNTLNKEFNRFSRTPIEKIIDAQRHIVDKLISPHYDGMLGIDMFILDDGNVHPCVEINLRMTMGHIAIACQRVTGFEGVLTLQKLEELSRRCLVS